nr:CCAAT/enhancer-binding protein zeta [Ipomoea batatas]
MANSKKSKKSKVPDDIDNLQNDVASFASSLGLSSIPSSTSGFDDSDFRKPPSSKPLKKPSPKQNSSNQKETDKSNSHNKKFKQNDKPQPRRTPLDYDNNSWKTFDKYKGLPKLPLVKASALGVWYADAAELEEKVVGNKKVEFGSVEEWKAFVQKKKELGERLIAQFAADYESSRGQSGDIKMLAATQRSGTAADKVSAFSVMVADNPVANMRSLDALLGMVTAKVGKRHALTGYEALRELFISSLLPDRKLKTLFQRPLNHVPDTKDGNSLLLLWYWEECLKQRYERFVAALEEASRDVLDILKDKALKTVYMLLRSKSEQERRLLSALVNKLGDPKNKVASNADYHLSKLLGEHPNMKAVVIDEVDNFLFRPHLGLRAKYHAINFLSQIRLSHRGDGPKIAKRLIEVYFALFKVLISEAGGKRKDKKNDGHNLEQSSNDGELNNTSESHVEMDSRLLSALLTGVNRAFPYVSSDEADDIVQVQTPVLFQLVHSRNFNVGVQALMLLDKISSKNQIVSDRFYRALYSKLLLPAAMNSSKEEMFIGLLLRAMKNDINLKRVAAFAKRLLQVAIQQPPQYACGCLFLLSEVLKEKPPLWSMMLQSESVDEDLEHFEDVKEDDENQASPATTKTVNVEGVTHSNDELNNESSSLDEGGNLSSDSEEDVQLDDLLVENGSDEPKKSTPNSNSNRLEPQISSGSLSMPGGYNLRHREPSFCNADHVSWWELMVLASHAHPSVATMARTLLSGATIVYNGNPLNDLSLTAFLDKFMEKKPKQSTWHGASQIEPAKKLDMNDQLFGEQILSLAETDVPPEDLVFHKFYMNKMKSSKKLKKKKKRNEDDDEGNIPSDISDGEPDIAEDPDDIAQSDDQEDSFDQRKRKPKQNYTKEENEEEEGIQINKNLCETCRVNGEALGMAAEEDKKDDLYAVLGLNKECTALELRTAYKKLAMKWHPDRCSALGNPKSVEEAKQKFQAIQQAYSAKSRSGQSSYVWGESFEELQELEAYFNLSTKRSSDEMNNPNRFKSECSEFDRFCMGAAQEHAKKGKGAGERTRGGTRSNARNTESSFAS